nr:hypothetical protein [Tanacetum cinerariifolium]
MIAILEKSEHNIDFHPIVDFVEASPLRRFLKLKDDEGISSLPDAELFENLTLMGYNISPNQKFIFKRTVSSEPLLESSLRRFLKLKDEEGISSLPDAELFENLTLMGYNISPNQKFIFKRGECSGTPTEPHHTPSSEAQQTSSTTPSSPTLPYVTTAPIPTVSSSDTPLLRQYTRKSRIAQSSDRANIAKTSTFPYDSAPRVTFPAADEGSMQQKLDELTALCTSLQRQHLEMVAKFEAQELEINIDVVPTAGLIIATATIVTPYTRRKGKETMVESETPKKKKVQEQIDAQVVRELEEQMVRENQRMSEQIARDAEIARIHAEEELEIMIDGLDRSNEIVAKYLQEY